jgi:outer membrane immunogenic protein
MKALRSRIVALGVLAGIAAAAAAPAAADGPRRDGRYYPTWQGLYAGAHLGHGELDPADGFVGGVHVGYNWQKGQIVYGLEADVSLSDISFDAGIGSLEIDWLATVRGRVGLLVTPSILAYATAGVGLVSRTVEIFGISNSDTETDLVLGLGVEGKLTDSTTLRLEYLTFDDTEVDVIRAGVSIKLGN